MLVRKSLDIRSEETQCGLAGAGNAGAESKLRFDACRIKRN